MSFITATQNDNNLDGSWIPIRQELAGKELPLSIFEKNVLILKDTSYSYTDHDKGSISYHDGKMDIYGTEGINKGKHYKAIYKIENGQLTVCYDLSGEAYPNDYETKSKPSLFISIYKKG